MLVGSAAAAVHWGVAVLLVQLGGWRPLVANGVAWLVALSVSFSGHYQLTFKRSGAKLWTAARRFFLVSALGFAVNEGCVAALLHLGDARFDVVLASVLVAVAAVTFVASRRWAFASSV